MDLFKIFGKIVIENYKANKSIDETTDKAENSSSRLGSAFSKIGNFIKEAFGRNEPKTFGTSLELSLIHI